MTSGRNILDRLLPVLGVVGFFVLWKAYGVLFDVSEFILPPPERILAALVDLVQEPTIGRHVQVTLVETVSGFLLATFFGVGLGALMGRVRWIERLVKPLIISIQVVPKIALVPLFIVWFGFGPGSKIVISAVLAFFPIFSNTLIGMKSVERGYRDVMASLNAKRWSTFWMLDLPHALPFILTGMEVGIVLSVIGAIVGEFVGGSEGLGNLALVTLQELQTPTLFAVIILLTLIGLALYGAVAGLRRLLVPWHESSGSASRA
jgi:NitT/TauT family transport system permease protein